VGGEDRLSAPLERLELVECVGIQDGGHLGLHQQPSNELALLLAPPQARPQRQRTCAPGRVQGLRERALDGLQHERLEHRQRFLRRGHGDVAGVRAKRGARGEGYSARHPRSAAHHEHRARRVLVLARALAGQPGQDLLSDQGVLGGGVLEPDVRQHDFARVEEPRPHLEADFHSVHRHCQVCAHRLARHLAGRRVHPRRDVHRHHRRPG
jgi:hypothetical protein